MYPTNAIRAWPACVLALIIALSHSVTYADSGNFSDSALRGVKRLQVRVEGIPAQFERYGLTASELQTNTEKRLAAYGLQVLDATTALADKTASQFFIKLYANQDTYSNYSCRVAVTVKRKLPLDPQGNAFVSEPVWSNSQNGLLNPSDLTRVYGYVDTIVSQFITDHGLHNSNSQAVVESSSQ